MTPKRDLFDPDNQYARRVTKLADHDLRTRNAHAREATETRIDGEGSGISFDFDALYPDRPLSQRGARLVVNGYIMNDNPGGLAQAVYVAGVRTTWSIFADNLYRG